MKQSVFLSQFGIICCLGASKTEVYSNLISGSQKGIISQSDFIPQKTLKLGTVTENLPEIPKNFSAYNTRCNQLLLAAYLQIEEKQIVSFFYRLLILRYVTARQGKKNFMT